METVAGIKYTKGPNGGRGFVHINLDIHGDNELLEVFWDLVDIESRKDEPCYPMEDVFRAEYERRGLKYNI